MLVKPQLPMLLVLLAVAAIAPTAATAAPPPAASAAPVSEQELFRRLRALPYFAGMTDEQLRAMPLPPGFKNWQEFLAANEQLEAAERAKPSPKPTVRPEDNPAIPHPTRDRLVLDKAKAGDAAAQAQIGVWSLYGRGALIPLSEPAAAKWLRLAAEQRNLTGVDYMSAFYESGNSVINRDRTEAYKWGIALKALQREAGKPTAETDARLQRIRAEMTPAQVKDAEARAKAWLAAHPPKRR
ncbi:MAG: hypothetical protein ACK46X_04345 [Candidatus Sericytochromatia bacterium]